MKKFYRVTATLAETGTCCCGPERCVPEGTQRIVVAEDEEEAEMQFLAMLANERAKENDPKKEDIDYDEGLREDLADDYIEFYPTKSPTEKGVWLDEGAYSGQGIVYNLSVVEIDHSVKKV